MSSRPGVGVGCYILLGGQVLLGYRTTGHASGVWAPPGGHIEFRESPQVAASREVLEETGLKIPESSWHFRAVTNDYFEDNQKHSYTFALVAEISDGEPKVLEPHKLDRWEWFGPAAFPKPLMVSVQHDLAAGLDFTAPLDAAVVIHT